MALIEKPPMTSVLIDLRLSMTVILNILLF
jgi:hypothetical protein